MSSAAVYGEDIDNLNITEETPINIRSYYGNSKYASERLFCQVLSCSSSLPLAILRPPLVYGKGDENPNELTGFS